MGNSGRLWLAHWPGVHQDQTHALAGVTDRGEESNTVSVSTLQLHHGYYRWAIERESAFRFVRLWHRLGSSELIETDQITLTNVLWAIASMERSYRTLEINVDRAAMAHNEGVPPVMAFMSGPYPKSLEYALGQSLWLDLADVLVWYRAFIDRLGHLKNAVRRGRIPLSRSELEQELSTADARAIREFGSKRVRDLADNLLHDSWHPTTPGTGFDLYWRQVEGRSVVAFTEEGDVMESLFTVVSEAIAQVESVINRIVP